MSPCRIVSLDINRIIFALFKNNIFVLSNITRSINTSLTTFIMVFVLFLLGVSSIREFALPLMVGIVCGTYSSVCVTGALWYVLTTRKQKKAEK